MATRQKQQLSLNLNFETTPIEQVSKHRLLGVTVDEQLKWLKWQMHINNIFRTVSRNISLLSKLSQIVSHQAKLGFFFPHIMSHINYVSNAWDSCACVHMKQLYSLHKRAIQFLMPSPNMDYNQKCCALRLDKQLLLNKCVYMQKVVHGKAPQYLKDLMIPQSVYPVSSPIGMPRQFPNRYTPLRRISRAIWCCCVDITLRPRKP